MLDTAMNVISFSVIWYPQLYGINEYIYSCQINMIVFTEIIYTHLYVKTVFISSTPVYS